MLHFLKRLKSESFNTQFQFNQMYTVNGMLYYITTIDLQGKLYFFLMEPKGNTYCIVEENIPEWIKVLETELSMVIIEKEKKY